MELGDEVLGLVLQIPPQLLERLVQLGKLVLITVDGGCLATVRFGTHAFSTHATVDITWCEWGGEWEGGRAGRCDVNIVMQPTRTHSYVTGQYKCSYIWSTGLTPPPVGAKTCDLHRSFQMVHIYLFLHLRKVANSQG